MTSNILSILQAVYAPVPIELITRLCFGILIWFVLVFAIETARAALPFVFGRELQ